MNDLTKGALIIVDKLEREKKIVKPDADCLRNALLSKQNNIGEESIEESRKRFEQWAMRQPYIETNRHDPFSRLEAGDYKGEYYDLALENIWKAWIENKGKR